MKLTTFVEHFYIFEILISNSIFTKENYPNFTFSILHLQINI